MAFPEWLVTIDKLIFNFINQSFTHPYANGVMVLLRSPTTWIPLYLFIIYWSFKNMRTSIWMFLLLSICAFAMADFASASIFKPFFARLRPCADPSLYGRMISLVGCGGKYSFPSSHAANHFALATYWFYSIRFVTKKSWYWLWLWAFSIGYAQIYVGKHFPVDIAGGAVLGCIIGLIVSKTFENWYVFMQQKQSSVNPAK